MGGAIAVHVGVQKLLSTSLAGLAVIDVVEGEWDRLINKVHGVHLNECST